MKSARVFASVYQKPANEKKMAMKRSKDLSLIEFSKLINRFSSEGEIKIDWDISLMFTALCEMKFDGKIRAMEMFVEANLICKVKGRKGISRTKIQSV